MRNVLLTGAQQPIPTLQIKIFSLIIFYLVKKFSILSENRQKSCLFYKKTICCFSKSFSKQTTNFVKENQDLQFGNGMRSKITSLNFCKMQHYQFLTLCGWLQERKLPGGRDEISNIVILSSLVLQCE